MNTSTLSTLIVALVLSIITSTNAATAGTCSATITIAARSGSSWMEGGLLHQIYDITVTNGGTCPINSLLGLFVFPSTAHVSEAWNYNQTTGQISGFSGVLVAGQTFFGSGLVLAGVGAPSLSLEHTLASCPATCLGSATAAPTVPATSAPTTPTATPTARPPTAAPTGVAPTATPTARLPTAAPTGVLPTAAPTGVPPTAAATLPACATRITITARANAAFLINGVASQIYDLAITNTGRTTVGQLDITISTTSSTAVVQDNKWNLVHVAGDRYSVLTYGGLTAGTTYQGAGFVLSGTSPSTATPVVAIFSTTC